MQRWHIALVAAVVVKLPKQDDGKFEMSLLKHCLECEMLDELKPVSRCFGWSVLTRFYSR